MAAIWRGGIRKKGKQHVLAAAAAAKGSKRSERMAA
jgi:hypothetical protein